MIFTIRNLLYDRGLLPTYKSRLKVVCVGNVVCGGSGKTPVVTEVVSILGKNNCAILLRGYKGRLVGPVLVNENHTALDVGDEALLHFKQSAVPVVVARDRVAGAKFIEENLEASLIVMDDGLQHRRLRRDLNILVAPEGVRKFSNRLVLPFGRCRESYPQALSRTDFALCYSEADLSYFESLGSEVGVLVREPCGVSDIVSEEEVEISEPVCVLTAVAKPERVVMSVQKLGISVVERRFFRDHHLFTSSDLKNLAGPVICTTKDAVKLRELSVEREKFYSVTEKLSMPETLVLLLQAL